jgi:two-component system CheB/CheR fusion protein
VVQDDPDFSQLVVIGASAGGIEALSTVLAALPADFPAPIVIAQHIDPSRVSHLQEILARRTTLPVHTVLDSMPLRPGAVYVVPADRNVAITDHDVRVHATSGSGPKPSVDLLLSTAASVFGEELFAVILSGSGSDGASGARQVKEAGGTVIVQNPETASHPGMPRSLAPTTIDIVADLEAIGPLLYDLLSGAYTPPPETDRQMRLLLERLRADSGIDFGRYRAPTIQRRLQRRMADVGRESIEEYLRYVQRHPEELRRLAESFLIRVTDFFRDPDLFAYLREHVLPDLIADARQRDNELRLWSAGCATGEEAYSLAILLSEALGNELDDFRIRIFATDVNAAAVDFARGGLYTSGSLRHLPPDLVQRYFTSIDGAYEIKKIVRRFVVFGQHDLAQRSPFPRLDLALCRNVLIYFTPELQHHVLQLFAFSLRQGGRLILGKSEATNSVSEYFVLEDSRLKVYRRQGDRILIAPAQIRGTYPRLLSDPVGLPPGPRPDTTFPRSPQASPLHPPHEPSERAVAELPVGAVVVDRHYDIRAINSLARRLLGIHTAAVGEDFVHLARRLDAGRLRTAIDRAFSGEPAVDRLEAKPLDLPPGARRFLEISCFPQQREAAQPTVDRVVIIVSEVSSPSDADAPTAADAEFESALAQAAARAWAAAQAAPAAGDAAAALVDAATALDSARAEIARLAAAVVDLSDDRRELLIANQDLARANTELRSQNDELVVAHEEAQAAVEEIETLNEEQQATNEELETLNEELQATIEELNTTNDDLEARGLQLQDTTIALEAERARFTAMLARMTDAVLLVDRAGAPLLSSAAYASLFAGPEAEAGFLDEDGCPLPPDAAPRLRAARGETFELQFALAAPDGSRRWFEAHGQPIAASGEEGGVIVIREITERSAVQPARG